MRKRKGLTVIETIVIIVIIGFLFIFLKPAFERYLGPKYPVKPTCMSNLKQFGIFYVMYCEDNNGTFSTGLAGKTDRDDWLVSLKPYYKVEKSLLLCPEAKLPRTDGNSYGGPNNSYQVTMDTEDMGQTTIASSYGLNCWLYNPPSDSNIATSHAAENFWRTRGYTNASQIPFLGDSMWTGSYPEPDGVAGQPPSINGQWDGIDSEMKHFSIDRHDSAINIVFMDGHVEKVGLKKLWKLKWHQNFDTSGPWTQSGVKWPEWMKKLKDK